jgi:DNA-binding transcriptional ArsR family regulator
MVNYSDKLSHVFAALADPTRRQIVERLARGGLSVSRLARRRGVTTAAVLKHLGVLEEAGLVETRKVGRVRECRLSPGPMRHAAQWIALYQSIWGARFDRLARHLDSSGGTKP